ncbi:MAG TPA: spondin domain-containing protein [Gemmatimonadales bacterium]
MSMGSAEYTIVLKSTWTPANHPYEYPTAGALTGPHFSGLIGASHDGSYTLFAEGSTPTPGLENLSEQGKHSPLDAEIRAAVGMGGVGMLFESGPLRDFGDSLVTTVRMDNAHPMVSLVAMIAPSPDWFTGASNINLMEDGAWVPSRTLTLNAYDSGGDDGTTYKAADVDANPKHPTMRANTRHFVVNGQPVPVATLMLRKN